MNKYDTDKINAIPILDVAEKLGVKFKKCSGKNYKTACLWHNETSASLVTQKDSNRCFCYGHCGRGYGVVDMIRKVLNKDFVGSCEWLVANGWSEILIDDNANPSLREPQGKLSSGQAPDENRGSRIRKKEARLLAPEARRTSYKDLEENTYLFSMDDIQRMMNMDNSFARCLKEVFGGNRAADVIRTYGLCSFQARYGGYPNVGFPLIDIKGRVRDFKIQAYECDPRSERFFHCDKSVCFWYGPTQVSGSNGSKGSNGSNGSKGLNGSNDPSFDCNCLFGEHLLALHPEKTVILVESPKNACVGYAEYPQYVWVAAGNKNMLKRDVLEALRGRRVVVFPDNDAYEEWSSKLDMMQDIALFYCMEAPGSTGDKGDIADWIISFKLKVGCLVV